MYALWYNNAIKGSDSTAELIRTAKMCNNDESGEVLLLGLVVSTGLGIGGGCPRGKPVLCVRELKIEMRGLGKMRGHHGNGDRTYESIGSNCDEV